jgi:DNA-binding CsgD family transcriptional regulator/PAS domain-containing protein
MIESQQLSQHIGEIYDAALDPALWPRTIEASCGLLRSCASAIASVDLMLPAASITYSFGVDPHYLEGFGKDAARYPFMKNLMRAEIGHASSASEKMSAHEFRNSSLYRQWREPKGHVIDLFNVTLERTATAVVHLGFVRHDTVGVVDAETINDLRLLFPHYRRAVLIGKVIEHARVEGAAFGDTLDGLAAGIFLVDAELRLIHANRSGEQMLEERTIVRKDGDVLAVVDNNASATLRKTCGAIAARNSLGLEGIGVAIRTWDGEPYIAHVLPLTSGARRKAGRFYRAVAAVFVRSAQLERPAALDAMTQLYGLTPAEIKALVGVVELGGIPTAARAYEVSPETIKTHLKRVFDKTGTSRQADLVKLMAGIVSPFARKRST